MSLKKFKEYKSLLGNYPILSQNMTYREFIRVIKYLEGKDAYSCNRY